MPGLSCLDLDGPQVQASPAGEQLGEEESRSDIGKELNLLYFQEDEENLSNMTTFDKCKKRWSGFQRGTQVNGSKRGGISLGVSGDVGITSPVEGSGGIHPQPGCWPQRIRLLLILRAPLFLLELLSLLCFRYQLTSAEIFFTHPPHTHTHITLIFSCFGLSIFLLLFPRIFLPILFLFSPFLPMFFVLDLECYSLLLMLPSHGKLWPLKQEPSSISSFHFSLEAGLPVELMTLPAQALTHTGPHQSPEPHFILCIIIILY